MHKVRAQQVLARIDALLRWEQRTDQQKEGKFAELGKHPCEVRKQGYWRLGYPSFEAYWEGKFPDSRRKAYCLMSIDDQLRKLGRHVACETWFHKVKESINPELPEGKL